MSDRWHVCAAAEFEPGDRESVSVDGREIGVLNVDGEYHAFLNRCPHQGGPVCEGLVRPRVTAEWPGPGEREERDVNDDALTLSCPWHGWEYDLESGEHLGESSVALASFDVVREDGELYVTDE